MNKLLINLYLPAKNNSDYLLFIVIGDIFNFLGFSHRSNLADVFHGNQISNIKTKKILGLFKKILSSHV